MTVYCAVDDDKYERIRYMADSMQELGKMLNTNPRALSAYKTRGQSWFGLKIIKVVINDEGESKGF